MFWERVSGRAPSVVRLAAFPPGSMMRDSAAAARRIHTPKVAGSIPAPAITRPLSQWMVSVHGAGVPGEPIPQSFGAGGFVYQGGLARFRGFV